MNLENKGSRILIVDDTVKNIQVLGTVLKEEGYQINVAQNGQQALDVVGKVHPDLILLDVMMPVMDGFEACKQLKENPETEEIPIIFLTAKVETDDVVKGFELGAVDYVTKPFNTIELLTRVNTHLTVYHLQQELEHLVEKRTAQLHHRVRELDGRDKLTHLQNSTPTLIEAYEATLHVVGDVLSVEKAAIYRPDAEGKRLEMKAAIGFSGPGAIQDEAQLGGQEKIPIGEGGSPVAETYLDSKPRTGEDEEAMVPILYGEEPLGVLWIDKPGGLGVNRKDLLNSLFGLGGESATLIRAAQLNEDLEAGNVEVSALLDLGE